MEITQNHWTYQGSLVVLSWNSIFLEIDIGEIYKNFIWSKQKDIFTRAWS